MPEVWTHWECCTCHKRYDEYDAAARCETGHIVTSVTQGFAAQIKRIMKKGKPDAGR